MNDLNEMIRHIRREIRVMHRGLAVILLALSLFIGFILGFYVGAKTREGIEIKRTESMSIGRVSKED